MSKHTVTVTQLQPNYGDAFLNIGDTSGGTLSVWGNILRHPTFLAIKRNTFVLLVCDKGWVAEAFVQLAADYDKVWEFTEGNILEIDDPETYAETKQWMEEE